MLKSRSREVLFNRVLVFKVNTFSSNNNFKVDDSCTFRYKIQRLIESQLTFKENKANFLKKMGIEVI